MKNKPTGAGIAGPTQMRPTMASCWQHHVPCFSFLVPVYQFMGYNSVKLARTNLLPIMETRRQFLWTMLTSRTKWLLDGCRRVDQNWKILRKMIQMFSWTMMEVFCFKHRSIVWIFSFIITIYFTFWFFTCESWECFIVEIAFYSAIVFSFIKGPFWEVIFQMNSSHVKKLVWK